MPCTICTLLRLGSGWIAECGKIRQGPYLSKGMAFRVAASEAQALRRHGQNVKITIQDETGAVCAEYCLCRQFKVPRPHLAAQSSV
jgi:hypothetical protein